MNRAAPSYDYQKPAALREQRIKYAAATSIGSKVMTISVQLFAMPIAIRALGAERFSLYAMISVALAWISFANIGVGPGLVIRTAAAVAVKDKIKEKELFASALIPVAAIALGFGILVGIGLVVFPVIRVFGPRYASYSTIIHNALLLVLTIFFLQAVISVVEAVQGGHQEQYILNLWWMAGNAVSLILLILISRFSPTVIGMIVAANVPQLVARTINSIILLIRRSYLLPRLRSFKREYSKHLINNGIAVSLVGICSYLNHQVPIIFVGRLFDVNTTASFIAVMNVFLLGMGPIAMFAIPLWPAISDSIARSEFDWTQRAYRKLRLFSMLYAFAVGFGLILIGRRVISLLYGPSVHPSQELIVLISIYFCLSIWEYINYMFLVGLQKISVSSYLYLARSILGIIGMIFLIKMSYGSGVILSLSCSLLFITGWSLPLLLRKSGLIPYSNELSRNLINT